MKKIIGSLMVVLALSLTAQPAKSATRTWEVVAADGSAIRYAQGANTVFIVAIRPCAYCVWQMM